MYAYDSQQWAKLKESKALRCSFLDLFPICEVRSRSNQELLSLSLSTFFFVITKFAFFLLLLSWLRSGLCSRSLVPCKAFQNDKILPMAGKIFDKETKNANEK